MKFLNELRLKLATWIAPKTHRVRHKYNQKSNGFKSDDIQVDSKTQDDLK